VIPLGVEAITIAPGLVAAIQNRRAARDAARQDRDRLTVELAAEVEANGTGTKAHDRLATFAEIARSSAEDSEAMLGELEPLFEVIVRRVLHAVCKSPSP